MTHDTDRNNCDARGKKKCVSELGLHVYGPRWSSKATKTCAQASEVELSEGLSSGAESCALQSSGIDLPFLNMPFPFSNGAAAATKLQ
jgi:hypothetical protein